MRKADGSLATVVSRGIPILRSDGKIREIVGTTVDVSTRRREEDALRLLSTGAARLSGTLDYQATLRAVAEMAIPDLADIATVDVFDEAGTLLPSRGGGQRGGGAARGVPPPPAAQRRRLSGAGGTGRPEDRAPGAASPRRGGRAPGGPGAAPALPQAQPHLAGLRPPHRPRTNAGGHQLHDRPQRPSLRRPRPGSGGGARPAGRAGAGQRRALPQGRGRQPGQGRVPGHGEPRAANPAGLHPRLVAAPPDRGAQRGEAAEGAGDAGAQRLGPDPPGGGPARRQSHRLGEDPAEPRVDRPGPGSGIGAGLGPPRRRGPGGQAGRGAGVVSPHR